MPRRTGSRIPGLNTFDEVAPQVKRTPRTVRRWVDKGYLRATRLGGPNGTLYVTDDDLLDAIKKGFLK